MSLESDAQRLAAEIEEQGTPPTAGQAVMSGCLGVAILIKAVFIVAITILMVWLLWACAGACHDVTALLPLIAW